MINHSMRASEAIGTIIRNAIVFNVKNWGKRPMPNSDIFATVEHLFDLFAAKQINFVLVGGIAILQYVEGRNTEDINFIVATSDIKKLTELHIVQDDLYFARGKLEGINVDFLLTRNKFFQKIQRSYQTTIHFFDRPIPCATVEGLLLLKMYALPSLYRQGNLPRASLYENDILNLLYNHRPSLVSLWPVLAKYLSESDFDAVTAVVSSIEARIALFRPNNQTS